MHGKTKIQASWWPLLNGCIPQIWHSVCGQQLVRSWQDSLSFFEWVPSSDWEFRISFQNELPVFSRVLYCHGKEKLRSQFNHLFQVGVAHLGDVVDNESQRLSEFKDVKWWLFSHYLGEITGYIPLLHGSLPLKTNVAPWLDWWLQDGTRLIQVTTIYIYILYHHAMPSLSWLSPKAEKVWNVCESNARWWKILQPGWHSHLPFHAKVFIWSVMIGGLLLGSALKGREPGSGTCFFCTIPLEDSTHRFIKCPITCTIRKYLSDVW